VSPRWEGYVSPSMSGKPDGADYTISETDGTFKSEPRK
jgi:hypothetical protein